MDKETTNLKKEQRVYGKVLREEREEQNYVIILILKKIVFKTKEKIVAFKYCI